MITKHGVITVTNYRVRMDSDQGSSSHYTSMTLDAVASCNVTTRSEPALIVLVILAVIGATVCFSEGASAAGGGSLVAALVFFVLYYASRSTTMNVTAHSGDRIWASLGDLQRGPMIQLLDAIEEAKLASIGRLEPDEQGHSLVG